MQEKLSKKAQCVNDAMMIVQSVEWIEKELLKCLEEMDICDKNKDFEGLLKVEKRVNQLVRKLEIEDKNVKNHLVKYENYKEDDEKEKELPDITKVKQTSNGRVPPNKRGKNSGH